jgi:DNA-binding transcriptional regulator of glucitol operon
LSWRTAKTIPDEIGKLAWGWLRATYDDKAQHNFYLDQLEKIKDQDYSSGSAAATGTTRLTPAAGPRTATTRPATPTATSASAAAPARSLNAPETGAT